MFHFERSLILELRLAEHVGAQPPSGQAAALVSFAHSEGVRDAMQGIAIRLPVGKR